MGARVPFGSTACTCSVMFAGTCSGLSASTCRSLSIVWLNVIDLFVASGAGRAGDVSGSARISCAVLACAKYTPTVLRSAIGLLSYDHVFL